jgi:signal transduction histidine kinase
LSLSVAVRYRDATAVRTGQQRYEAMKDTDRVLRSLLAWDGTAAISVVLAVCAWMIEAALDSFVFRLGPLHERLLPLNDPNEIWMRVEAIGTFLILSVYCHVIIAQRKRVEAERAQLLLREHEARQQAEQAVRVRDHVLAAASHDLRTPLATIVSRTGLLQGRLGRQQHLPVAWLSDQLDAMGEAAQAMFEAVEGITDAARLQMGRELILRVEAVDLSALVRSIVRTFNEASLWSGAAPLEASIGEGVLVQGDRARLRRVVENLLGNAVKYSPQGTPVQVEVRATEEGAVLAVRDRGVGIAEDELPHIFRPFYRASTVGDVPGAGIGLASAKTIVEQHGGQIRVASALGVGTTVVVALPPAGHRPAPRRAPDAGIQEQTDRQVGPQRADPCRGRDQAAARPGDWAHRLVIPASGAGGQRQMRAKGMMRESRDR